MSRPSSVPCLVSVPGYALWLRVLVAKIRDRSWDRYANKEWQGTISGGRGREPLPPNQIMSLVTPHPRLSTPKEGEYMLKSRFSANFAAQRILLIAVLRHRLHRASNEGRNVDMITSVRHLGLLTHHHDDLLENFRRSQDYSVVA